MKNHSQKHSSKTIFILTGAGISAESGIKTFRDDNGLWENHPIDKVATPEGFLQDPGLVHHFYNQRRRALLSENILPNEAHLALANLEKYFPGKTIIVTQNIDNLHERAGSQNVLHMHGELLKIRCSVTGEVYPTKSDLDENSVCKCCKKKGNLRPHVVWFGEIPLYLPKIYEYLEKSSVFIAIGTSGQVYPANQFSLIAYEKGAHCFEINLKKTRSGLFHENWEGLASKLVPKLCRQIIKDCTS